MSKNVRYLRKGSNWKLEPTLRIWELFPSLSDPELRALVLPSLGRLIDLGWRGGRWSDSSLTWEAYWLCEYWVEVLRFDIKDDRNYTVLDLENFLLHRFGGRDRFEREFSLGLRSSGCAARSSGLDRKSVV